jgi:adenine nucleotide transporter 17
VQQQPALATSTPLPASVLPALRALAAQEGAGALYAGLGTAVGSMLVSSGVFFWAYALLRNAALRRRRGGGEKTRGSSGTLGGAAAIPVTLGAGFVNVLLTNPLWVLVARLQAAGGQSGRPQGPLAAARVLLAEGGPRALWRGTGAALVMLANPVVQFAVVEWLQARLAKSGAAPRTALRLFVRNFGTSALGKVAATLATYPMQVVKQRQQSAAGSVGGPLAEAASLWRSEGLAGLYCGLETKMLQTVLCAGLVLATKERTLAAARFVAQKGDKSA